MAARKSTTQTDDQVIDILEVTHGEVVCHILGSSTLICNRMSEKG